MITRYGKHIILKYNFKPKQIIQDHIVDFTDEGKIFLHSLRADTIVTVNEVIHSSIANYKVFI